MRNIGHMPAYVATHHGTNLPTVLPRSTRGRLHVWGSAIRMRLERSRQRRALAAQDDRLLRYRRHMHAGKARSGKAILDRIEGIERPTCSP